MYQKNEKCNRQNQVPNQMDDNVREEQVRLSLGTYRTTSATKRQLSQERGRLLAAGRIRLS